MTARLGIIAALTFLALVALDAQQTLHAAEGATIAVQGVKASGQGKNPDIDAGLKAYGKILKNLGYAKYEDLGKGSGTAAAGQSADVKIHEYTVTITVEKIGGDATSIKYLVKKDDKELVNGPLSLTKGKPKLIQFGAQNPVILFIQLK